MRLAKNLLAAAALLFAGAASAQPCFDDFAGMNMGHHPSQDAIVVACWVVNYNAGTQIVNSQGQAVDPHDIPVNADVIFDACYGENWTFTASRIEWVTTGALVCSENRDGILFAIDHPSQTMNVNCWPVRWDANTQFQNQDGELILPTDIMEGDELAAIGCVEGNGFTLLADVVVVGTDGTVVLPSTSDVQLVFAGTAGYVLSQTSDKGAMLSPAGTPHPSLRLQEGKRYMVSHSDLAGHPFELGVYSKLGRRDRFVPFLSTGAAGSAFETDPAVDFVVTDSEVFFTLTPRLAAELRSKGAASYRDASAAGRGRLSIAAPK